MRRHYHFIVTRLSIYFLITFIISLKREVNITQYAINLMSSYDE